MSEEKGKARQAVTSQRGANRDRRGYYAHRFTPSEAGDLIQADGGLADEIDMMRVMIRRVFDQASDEAATLKDWVDSLGALGSAASRLAGLLKAERDMGDAASLTAAAISQALGELVGEMRK